MPTLREKLAASPAVVRTVPFGIFLVLTACQGKFFGGSEYWLYLAKTILGAALIWLIRPAVREMRWKTSCQAVVVGIAVFAVWVGTDPFYKHLGAGGTAWNPFTRFGQNSPLAWGFVAVRLLGSTFIVPPLEEMFYRSFVYRSLAGPKFEEIAPRHFSWFALLATSAAFGLSHHEWLAGILCGLAYQLLVIRNNRFGDAITAHAITNFLLALWVVFKPAWNFW